MKQKVKGLIKSSLASSGYVIEWRRQSWITAITAPFLKPFSCRLIRAVDGPRAYIDCQTTIEEALKEGLSIPAYVAQLWQEQGVVEECVAKLRAKGVLATCSRVVEIGPGTGRFLEHIQDEVRPEAYEIYEIDNDWATYLVKTYGVVKQNTLGDSLTHTETGSCGLVHAHGVFLYLPIVTAFNYLAEMCRVCAKDGFILFDCYLDDTCDIAMVEDWRKFSDRWQVILPRKSILDFMANCSVFLVDEFAMKVFRGKSQYLVFRKS